MIYVRNDSGHTDRMGEIRTAPSALPVSTSSRFLLFPMLIRPSPNGQDQGWILYLLSSMRNLESPTRFHGIWVTKALNGDQELFLNFGSSYLGREKPLLSQGTL